METSKLSNDSLFRKKEKAIQQYISMIGDQKFFDQMRGQAADKERPLLRAIVGANQRNHYDSRYGKSKSVSLQDDGIIDDRPASEDFGNDSNYGDNNETPGKNFGDTIHEVPHNDPKGRDEFHFKSRTVYSQASETKPDRSKEPSKPILREITILQKGPDETRSEALPKSKNKTSSGLLPSLSKPTVSGVAVNPQTLQKNYEADFQKRPSVTTKQDFHIEPRTGEAQTSEFKLVNDKIRSEPKNLKEASRPTIRDMGIEPRLLESKESAGYLEQKPVSIAPTAPRPISALQGEGKTSNFTIRNTNKRQTDQRSTPSLDEIGSSISKFDIPMPQLHNQGSRRSVDKSGKRTAPEIPKLIPLLPVSPKVDLVPTDINISSMHSVGSQKESGKDRRWTRQLSALGQEDGDWSRGVKYTTTHDEAVSQKPHLDATPLERSFEKLVDTSAPEVKGYRPNAHERLASKSSRVEIQEETAHWRSSGRNVESSYRFGQREPRPEIVDFGVSVGSTKPKNSNVQPPVDFYTAEELARARNQIKSSIENMFDMKQEMATDGELAQLIARFYHLMMDERNHLGKDKLEIVLDLVAFYQSYVKKLKGEITLKQEDIKSKQTLVVLQREKSQELEKAVRNMSVQVREAHEDRVELGRKLRAAELSKKENDMRVKQVEERYHENITKFKEMLRVVNEEVAFTRQSEMKAYEKVNALKHEYDKIYNENVTLKTQVTNLDYKSKENQFEVDRLIEEIRGHTNRSDGLLRERDMLASRIRDYQLRMSELEGAKVEIENHRAKSYELQRNLDSLRAELRNRDLKLMELEHKVKYNENVKNLLLEENTRIIDNKVKETAKWREKIDEMQDKGNNVAGDYYADRLNQSGTTLKKAGNNALKNYPTATTEIDPRRNRGVSYGTIVDGMGGLNTASFGTPTRNNNQISRATANSRANPFSKPVDQMSDNDIRNLVQEYNTQLSQYQDKKVILDSMLCRLPEKPKTQKDIELKANIEDDYNLVINKIAEFKKVLRDLKAL